MVSWPAGPAGAVGAGQTKPANNHEPLGDLMIRHLCAACAAQEVAAFVRAGKAECGMLLQQPGGRLT